MAWGVACSYCSATFGHRRSAGQPARWMVDDIVSQEPKAERSLMHRFNIALVHSLISC